MMHEMFWMCWVEGNSDPRYKHHSRQDALVECERLAVLTGRPVYLLAATNVCRLVAPPVEWSRLDEPAQDWSK